MSASVLPPPLELSIEQRTAIVERKATCPFLGPAVATGVLPVRNSIAAPLASIDDIVRLGNTGEGSDLGNLLALFAKGNHAFMPGPTGRLDVPAPAEAMSLDLPGSQGSHAGHSGILQGDPREPGSGRFSDTDFARLLQHAENGCIERSAFGKFIARNILRDRTAHAPGLRTALQLAGDLVTLAGQVVHTLHKKANGTSDESENRKVFTKLTKLLGEDHLLASSGEFGLLAAFLAHSPRTQHVRSMLGTEPAYAVDDLTVMFHGHRLPDGWERWQKTALDWAVSAGAIAVAAEREFISQRARN